MCLLDVLISLSREMDFRIHVVHLNHHMREEAERDAEMVSSFARERGIEVTVGHADVLSLAREMGIGLEEAGRHARYRFFREVQSRLGADRIALGHTMNDQAETVLMRLLRGSGTEGLSGIPPVNGDIVRPIIEVPRELTEEYCQSKGIPVVTDLYNLDLRYTRNLIRHRILPVLARQFNPSLVRTLSDVAMALRWDAEYLEAVAREAFLRYSLVEGRVLSLVWERVKDLPRAVSSRVIEQAWRECSESCSNLNLGHIRQILDGGKRTWSLPGDVRASNEGGLLSFYPRAPHCIDLPLLVPGETLVPELGLKVRVRFGDRREFEAFLEESRRRRQNPSLRCRFPGVRNCRVLVEQRAYLDYNKCSAPIRLRTRRSGDRFVPLGFGGKEQKLQDYFISRGVPRFFRDFVPIFVSGQQIIWVGGFRLDERFKVEPCTQSIAVIEIEPYLRCCLNCATI